MHLEEIMDIKAFRKCSHELVDWMASFLEEIESYPVRSQIQPGDIKQKLPDGPPQTGEPFEKIMEDFESIILPGITHWQHPSFFAYFPANSSYPSVLAEMLTATLGAQCMIWQTSPAAAELEERMMSWLGGMLGLPASWHGVIQDSASTATLCSILTARERATRFGVNERGFIAGNRLIVYGSEETHSSIEKAVKIAGIGTENLRKVEVDASYAMIPEKLEEAIEKDMDRGFMPCCAVATLGTTGSTAIDPLEPIGEICRKHGVWLHVDAALAGSALVLPECRYMINGLDHADTFVFNPHKWMFTNFDCSAYFVKDREALIKTFEIHPEYLKTKEGTTVNNYRDWGIQLGRRFRALKLWFVIRTFGVRGIQDTIRSHIRMARSIVEKIEKSRDFELLAPAPLNTVCFRYKPEGISDPGELNDLNAELLEKLNSTGKVYFTHTKLDGKYTIRFVIGQTYVTQKHVDRGWELIVEAAVQCREKAARLP
jgi:aromatic-L-amino-acid decarboxylase